MNRAFIVAAGFVMFLTSPAAAQRPLASPPATPQFLSHYDFHLSAAALANDDPRFSWDTRFGGVIDVVDYVSGRAAAVLDYEAVLGHEFRPFDPNQGNYILEVSTSYRIQRTEVAAFFHHVSRHLSDRPKLVPVAWNIAGLRMLRQETLGKATIDTVAEFGGTTERVNVDYRWSTNVDVVVRRPVAPRAAVFAHGVGHVMSVAPSRNVAPRHTQTGGLVEGGLQLIGEAGVGEFFVGYEHRFDAYPLGFMPEQWFMVGFRVVRR